MKIIAVTQKGPGKAENEDRIVVGKNLIAEGVFQTELSCGIVAVADGVGGNKGGALASHYVAEQLMHLENVSANALAGINERLLAQALSLPGNENMATTLSGLSFCGGTAQLFSIGNTRVYQLRGSKYLKQLTVDDTTLNDLLSMGRITLEDAENFSRKNEITACFGGGKADLFRISCKAGNIWNSAFVITSDGIHDYLSTDQMEEVLSGGGITMETCTCLIAAARNAGSADDASVVLGEI